MLYMVTFTINIPQMLAYIPYMDPMGILVQVNDYWSIGIIIPSVRPGPSKFRCSLICSPEEETTGSSNQKEIYGVLQYKEFI